jgi:hypothetical protein
VVWEAVVAEREEEAVVEAMAPPKRRERARLREMAQSKASVTAMEGETLVRAAVKVMEELMLGQVSVRVEQ